MRDDEELQIPSDVFVFLIQLDPGCAFCQDEFWFLLHTACYTRACHAELIRLLVELNPGAVSEITPLGEFPFHLACHGGVSLTTMKMLFNHHGTEVVHMRSLRRGDALHWACLYGAEPEVAFFLLQLYPNGARTVDMSGYLPIHYACSKGAPLELVKLLIELYPDSLRVQTSRGRLPLHNASCGNVSRDTLQLVRDLYPDGIHVADSDGRLPLHMACMYNRTLDHIRLLVHWDSFALFRKTDIGETPLQVAYSSNRSDEIKALLLDEQEILVRSHRFTIEFVAKVQLGFPDAAVNKIWLFAQPDVWHPAENED